jgi:electron transfer flavoprotein alpha subunit
MTTLLIAEHEHATLKDSTNKALTAASQLGGEVHILVAGGGEGTKAAAEAAAKLAGVKKVLVAEGEPYAHDLAEPLAALIVALAPGYDAFVAPATSRFKNVMPRVAALLDVMQVSEIIKVVSPDTFERPIYAGNAIQTVKSKDAKKVITVRTSTFAAASEGGGAPIENAASVADPALSSFVGEEVAKVAARCRAARTSPNISSRWRTSSAPASAPRARLSMPATRRTTGRSARPARWWRPNSISPSASPARSSTSPA